MFTPQSHIKGLIFDLDGTLADTMPMHIESWMKAGEQHGVLITEKMIHDYAGVPTVQVIEIFNKEFEWNLDPYDFREAKNTIYLDLKAARGIEAITEVVQIADRYRSVYPLSVGTGSTRENAESALKALNISQWFMGLVSADDVTMHKPHPQTYLRCAEIMEVPPHTCHVFEDSPVGIQAALDAGMTATNIQTGEEFQPY